MPALSVPVEAGTDSVPVPVALRPRRLGVFAAVAAFALAADIISKVLVVANLEPGVPKRALGGAVYLLLTRNSGAAFSVGTSATIIFSAIAVVVVVVIARTAARLRSIGWAIALALVLGGALGNLTDRVLRAPGWGRGHVVDWISVFADDGHVWPIFNLADSAIDCGGVLAAALALVGIGFDGRRSDRHSRDKEHRRSRDNADRRSRDNADRRSRDNADRRSRDNADRRSRDYADRRSRDKGPTSVGAPEADAPERA